MTSSINTTAHKWLPYLALLECVTVLVLFGNLATAHITQVASAIGPIHGATYVSTIIAACLSPISLRTKLLSALPVIGGIVVLVTMRRKATNGVDTSMKDTPV